ncbi:enterobactin synthase subunit E [Salmonella enterica subsp. enterica serovar Panama]|nr:enterobactin synthase subunit E [Salmonella enterica subsp. enterica serovar Panama]
MRIPFTRWPDEFARRYREKGYWQDVPLTDILTRHADSDKTAVIEGERAFSYRQLNQAADNLACYLRCQGIKPGETALVQLGNVPELYITFFALLKLGVAPVLALFSHQRTELNAYAMQIAPTLVIADRQHTLFAGRTFSTRLWLNTALCGWCYCVTTTAITAWTRRCGRRRKISPPRHHLLTKWPTFSFPAVLPARQSLFPVPITTITTACAAAMRFAVSTRRRVFCARFPPRITTP